MFHSLVAFRIILLLYIISLVAFRIIAVYCLFMKIHLGLECIVLVCPLHGLSPCHDGEACVF